MKKELLYSRRFTVIFSLIIALAECILYHASFLASFRGFGDVSLEYTVSGSIALGILTLIPLLLLIAVLLVHLIKLHRCISNKKEYVIEIIGFVLGFGIGILIWMFAFAFSIPLLEDLLYESARLLAVFMKNVGWLTYPIP